MAVEQAPQVCMSLYHTTAHQGLLQEPLHPPMPLQGLGEAKGRRYTADELTRKFSQALCPRTTQQYVRLGGLALQRHF